MGQGHPSRPNPPLTRTTLGQLCAASWVSRLRLAVTQPGIEPGSVVMPQALDHCASLEANMLCWLGEHELSLWRVRFSQRLRDSELNIKHYNRHIIHTLFLYGKTSRLSNKIDA